MQAVDVCIVGAGPGGALASYLLAKKGFSVLLVERTDQSNKAFRGEHLNEEGERILKKYGLFDKIEARGLLRMEQIEYWQRGELVKKFMADPVVGHLGIHVPQSHLLDVLLEHAVKFETMTYCDQTRLVSLVQNEHGAYTGIEMERAGVREHVAAKLIVGADGRFSTVRKLAKLEAPRVKHGYDVLWARIPAPSNWTPSIKMTLVDGQQLSIFSQTNGFIQIGWNIPEGSFSKLRKESFEPFIANLLEAFPELEATVHKHIQSWADFVLLDVFSALADDWGHDGVVLIGDAAHTMTPTGAFGLNCSLRDAEILAELLTKEQLAKFSEIHCAATRKEEMEKIQALQREKEQQFSYHFAILM